LGRVNFADSSAFLTELNSAEMAGFLFYSFTGGSQSTNGEARTIYQKRGDAAGYEHRMQPLSEAATLAGLQSQGAEGYLQTGIRVDGIDFKAIFSKLAGQTTTYEFVDSGALAPGVTANESLASLNRFGAQGYCKLDLSQDGKVVLGKDASTASRCTFEYGPLRPTTREFVDVMNEKGAKGARYVLYIFSENEGRSVFVRDETQQTVFHHRIVEMPSNGAGEELLAFFDREGASGARPYQSFAEGNRTYIIFMTAYGCKGLLC
jgi:hypothetical protein